MRKKIDIKIFLGVCIILVSGLVYFFLEVYTPNDTTEYIQVLVAKENILENTIITESHLTEQTRVAPLTEKHIVNNKNDIIGKRVKSLIVEGEAIKTYRLTDNTLDYEILESNVRELVIPVSGNWGSLKLRVGGYIDVLGRPTGDILKEPELILSGKKIIYMRSNEGSLVEDNINNSVSSVVILVDIDEYNNYTLKLSKFGQMSSDILGYGIVSDLDQAMPFTIRSSQFKDVELVEDEVGNDRDEE